MRKIVCLVAVVLVPACGGSGGNEAAPGDASMADRDAAVGEAGLPTKGGSDAQVVASGCDHAAALCAKLDECAPFLLAAAYGDAATCADRLTKACTEQSLSSGSGMTEASILACEASLAGATCGDVFANNLPGCVFHGTLVSGATCGDNSQCASGFCSLGGNLCGVCVDKGAAGAACPSGSNDECQTGLVCSSGKICAQPAVVGAACDDATQPCLTGSFCTTAKTCALTVGAGQDCPGAYINLGNGTLCLGKSTATSPQTSVQIGTASKGEPCGLIPGDSLPPTLCAPGSVAACTLVSGSIQLFGMPTKGICAAPLDDGHTCTAGDICQPGAQCISGSCRIPSGRYCQQAVDAGG
jgi:hypothetical protein